MMVKYSCGLLDKIYLKLVEIETARKVIERPFVRSL